VTLQSPSGAVGAPARTEAASRWLVRHSAGEELGPSELQAWDVWIANPNNSAEYDELMRLRWELSQLPRMSRPTPAELHSQPPADILPRTLSATDAQDSYSYARHPRPRLRVALAACVAALLGILSLRFFLWPGSFALDSGHGYATRAGEQQEIRLKDGSVVTLGASSAMTVTYGPTRRTVFLERGEARFRVQHDPLRPFTVFAALGSVTAVGTVFDVHRYSDRVLVTVSEGAVQVAPQEPTTTLELPTLDVRAPAPHWTPVRVAHGHEVSYDTQGKTAETRPSDPQTASTWAQGALVYRGRPLSEVIEDAQRYTTRHIVLDPLAGDQLYTGTLLESDVDQWLAGLPKIFPVEVTHSDPDLVIIRPVVAQP
jgi:transmembrane sensor